MLRPRGQLLEARALGKVERLEAREELLGGDRIRQLHQLDALLAVEHAQLGQPAQIQRQLQERDAALQVEALQVVQLKQRVRQLDESEAALQVELLQRIERAQPLW